MALLQAAKTAQSQVQTENNGDNLWASKGIVITSMKLYFLCRNLTVMNQLVHVFPLFYEIFIFKSRLGTVNHDHVFALSSVNMHGFMHIHLLKWRTLELFGGLMYSNVFS